MLYLYAFSEPPTTIPSVAGIGGSPLAVERVDRVDAVISVLRGAAPVEVSEDAIRAHARVVEDVARQNAAVLPARFGRGYRDVDALREAVRARATELSDGLARVRGCLEVGLRVLVPPHEHAAGVPSSGGEYLRARLDERLRGERLADALHAPLDTMARASTCSVLATPRLLLSASYLVPHDALDAFRDAVAELQRAHPDLSLACTGPWPPYSFATAESP
jgi:hypothetical protein